jgi:hypothetical protein
MWRAELKCCTAAASTSVVETPSQQVIYPNPMTSALSAISSLLFCLNFELWSFNQLSEGILVAEMSRAPLI